MKIRMHVDNYINTQAYFLIKTNPVIEAIAFGIYS